VLRVLVFLTFTAAILFVLYRPDSRWNAALVLAAMHLFLQLVLLVIIW